VANRSGAAFDDQDSTFIVPSGGGFGVTFCPPGRSTTILTTMANQLAQLRETGHVTQQLLADTMNATLIKEQSAASRATFGIETFCAATASLIAVVYWTLL
jgi:hypothetical protein